MDTWFQEFFYKTAWEFLFWDEQESFLLLLFTLEHTSNLCSVLILKLKCWLLQAFLKEKDCVELTDTSFFSSIFLF